MKKKVLIIEDDQEINKLLQVIIKKIGLESISAYSGSEGALQIEQQSFDLVLLDLMLPGLDGKEVLAYIRENFRLPVIIISARNEIDTKIEFLKMGADDYITKPFNQEEVAVRIEVQLRKNGEPKQASAKKWRELALSTDTRTVLFRGIALHLTNAEFDILSFLMDNPNRALSKKVIYENVWRGTYVGDDNTISVHVSNLRKKITVGTDEEYIKTIWGIGFMLI